MFRPWETVAPCLGAAIYLSKPSSHIPDHSNQLTQIILLSGYSHASLYLLRIIMDVLESNAAFIAVVAKAVREAMANNDASHDFFHVKRVVALSQQLMAEETKLCPEYNYDPLTV